MIDDRFSSLNLLSDSVSPLPKSDINSLQIMNLNKLCLEAKGQRSRLRWRSGWIKREKNGVVLRKRCENDCIFLSWWGISNYVTILSVMHYFKRDNLIIFEVIRDLNLGPLHCKCAPTVSAECHDPWDPERSMVLNEYLFAHALRREKPSESATDVPHR